MDYMKGYNNRKRRRRRARSRFFKDSDNYIGNSSYSSRSKYRSSMGQAVSGRWIVCLIAVIVVIAVVAVCLVQAKLEMCIRDSRRGVRQPSRLWGSSTRLR